MSALCEGLIAARKQAGLTQSVLAHRLGRPQSFVAKYESGERRVDVSEFLAINEALQQDTVKNLLFSGWSRST